MDEKKNQSPDEIVARSMADLIRSTGSVMRNPLGMGRKTGRYVIRGIVTWEDDNSPVEGLTLGLGGTEARTDADGQFVIIVEKK